MHAHHPRRAARATALVFAAALTLLASCGGEPAEEEIAADAAALPADTAVRVAPAEPVCPETGAWQPCNLEKRLERAGFVVVRREGDVRHPFLDVAGTAYMLGSDELQVFFYPTAEARERDLEGIDPVSVSPVAQPIAWEGTPTLIVSNNLAAILIGGNARKVERVQDALTAGLPQP